MRITRFQPVLMLAIALCLCVLPAAAGVVFSDLGPPGDVYNCCTGWTVSGTGSVGTSYTAANLFTAAGSGALSVTEIDLAVGLRGSLATFYAAIQEDNSGTPGAQVPGAYWAESTSTVFGTCCGLVSITGITGVTLTGGQQYFMVLGPMDINDNSWNPLNWNNQNVTGDDQYSTNGGVAWTDNGSQPLGAFQILGGNSSPNNAIPEPGSLFLLGTGLIGILGACRRKSYR